MRYSEIKIVESKQKTITESSSGYTRVTVDDKTYDVGNDYVRKGNSYAIFSGNSAASMAAANGWIVPTKEIIQAIEGQGKLLKMPARNNNPTDTDAKAHTEQIFEENNLSGFPSGLVYGHKKEVIQGDGGTRLYGGNFNGYPLQSGNSDQHGGGYVDYSQGLRAVKLVEDKSTKSAEPEKEDAEIKSEAVDLKSGPPFPKEAQIPVAIMQAKLEELGYDVGTTGVDGKYGFRTAKAVRAFKKDFNLGSNAQEMSAKELEKLNAATPVKDPTPSGNHDSGKGGSNNLQDIEFAKGSESGRVMMKNSGATRSLPLKPKLMQVLDSAAEAAGVEVVVFSGGQPASGSKRVGSDRHNDGMAADVWIYSDGKRLRTDREDPIVAKFIASAVAAGARGIGAGPGYMDNVGIHVDLWGDRLPGGSNTWGSKGRLANTPDYVSAAYRAGQTGEIA